jgi:hypothetical protein
MRLFNLQNAPQRKPSGAALRGVLQEPQYYDYESGAMLMHRTVKAPFAGVMTQVRDPFFNEWPEGLGYYLLSENDPAFKPSRIKRSFWMDLYAVQ